ncbi:hypothetical protein DFH29DRAFT_997942 [Suillus ampliporus]|nr:hypothetical protein DFH29DRAFT_997942 [Suillus ampliporus]
MDTLNLTKKRRMSPSAGHKDAASKNEKINVKRPKLEAPDPRPMLEAADAEPMFPLPPFRQTPGPISASQTYLCRLILERWEAEVKACEKAKNCNC